MASMVPVCDKRYHIYNRFRHFWAEIKKLWNYPLGPLDDFCRNWMYFYYGIRGHISERSRETPSSYDYVKPLHHPYWVFLTLQTSYCLFCIAFRLTTKATTLAFLFTKRRTNMRVTPLPSYVLHTALFWPCVMRTAIFWPRVLRTV